MNSRAAGLSVAPRLLPLLLLFAGSGCAALVYEIVWFQMLELIVGSSAVSMAVVLGTFMGGMGLGNLVLPRVVGAHRHPLRVYAGLELGIALSAALVWFALPAVGHLYAVTTGAGRLDIVWRATICVIFLLPPTMFMGATLPVIARWTRTTPQGVSWLGACYGINIAGAVLGCLIAGFYLLRIYDLAVATACAVVLNVAVALIALVLARAAPQWITGDDSAPAPEETRSPQSSLIPLLISIGLSGFCALVAQVIWTRLLSLMLGGTTYTFSIILAVFLSGLGIGGFVGAALARRVVRPGHVLGWCQLGQVLAIAWADDLMTRTLPFLPSGDATDAGVWARFASDLLRCSYALLPATILWGASFPLAIAAGSGRTADPGRSVGRIYAANTAGAVLGAVLASLFLLPWLGTSGIETMLFAAAVVSAMLLVRPIKKAGWATLVLAVALAIWLGMNPSTVPWQLVAYGRHAGEGDQTARILYLGEGSQATVAVSQNFEGNRYYHVSGKTEASSNFHDMRVQRMLGHLPALLHPQPRSVLVVGCGAGVTAGSLTLHPSIERVVICEIEPLVVQHVAGLFGEENHHVVDNPKVEIVYDDARHYLATTHEKFDIITTDPIHPWVKGAAKLYTAEYLTLCRERLKPGGLVTQWVPFYQSSRAVVQSELATFFDVLPDGVVWGNDTGGKGYDSVLIGGTAPLVVDVGALRARLARPDHAAIREALTEVYLANVVDLLGTYAGRATALKDWLAEADINHDRSLRLQFLAGLSLHSRAGAAAYREMFGMRRFSADLFVGDEAEIAPLRKKLDAPAQSAGDTVTPR